MASPSMFVLSDYLNDVSPQQRVLSPGDKIMVAIIVALFSLVVSILILHIYGQWCLRSSNRRLLVSARPSPTIRLGLNKKAISLLPTFIFTEQASQQCPDSSTNFGPVLRLGVLECSVCLTEFQKNEKGWMLPACKHSFHIECIDMWFFSHSTCPLCRAEVSPTQAVTDENQQPESGAEGQEQASSDTRIAVYFSSTVSVRLQQGIVIDLPASAMLLPSAQPDNTSSTEKQPVPSFSASERASRRCMPQITIEIPAIQREHFQISSSECVSLPSQISRRSMSPGHQSSCFPQSSMESSINRGSTLKRIMSTQAGKKD